MKRSRTCQCLVELDSPKRTRSTPDLAALRRKHNTFERERSTFDDSMMTASAGLAGPLHILWRASSPVATASAAAAAAEVEAMEASAIASMPAAPIASSEASVVDSVVRRGSLNEITILEHEQFIGEEGAGFVAGGVSNGLLFGGASPRGGLLDDDSGDSSDYFCGVASSDEGDEDSTCGTTTTATPVAADAVGDGISSSSSGFDAPCVITPNMSDTESAGQVSDASSHAAATKDHAGDNDVDARTFHADGAVSPPAPPLSSWGNPRNCGVSASFPPTRFAGGSVWRQQTSSSCPSRVIVRVTGSLGVSGDLGGVSSSSPHFSEEEREEEKDRHSTTTAARRTVSPPWPFLVSASAWRGAPASAPAAFYGDSLGAVAAAAAAARAGVYVVPEAQTGRSQQYGGHGGGSGGGSIFSAGEEVKILGGFDRLRLVDHPNKPLVVAGSLDPVWTCRGSRDSSSSLGVGVQVEAEGQQRH